MKAGYLIYQYPKWLHWYLFFCILGCININSFHHHSTFLRWCVPPTTPPSRASSELWGSSRVSLSRAASQRRWVPSAFSSSTQTGIWCWRFTPACLWIPAPADRAGATETLNRDYKNKDYEEDLDVDSADMRRAFPHRGGQYWWGQLGINCRSGVSIENSLLTLGLDLVHRTWLHSFLFI